MERFPRRRALAESRPSSAPLSEAGVRLERAARNEIQPSRVERVKKAALETIHRITQVAALMSIAGAGNYINTEYQIREVKAHGEAIYEHPDKETNDILNYLLGRGPAPTDTRLLYERPEVVRYAQETNQNLPAAMETMTEPQLRTLYEDLHLAHDAGHSPWATPDDEKKAADFDFDSTTPEYHYDPAMYRAFWRLQEQVGAPRIRWMEGTEDADSNPLDVLGPGRAHYSATENTVYVHRYIPPERADEEPKGDSGLTELISEDAHALQRERNYERMALMTAEGLVRVAARMLKEHDSLADAYLWEYDRPGSVEYEAHKVIEPQLKNELKTMEDEDMPPPSNAQRHTMG